MKKILIDENWNEEEIESPEYTFIALLKQGSFDYGYVEAYDIDDSLVKQAYDNLVNQFKDIGCEEDTEICLIQLPTSKRICDLCDKAKFNGNNQSISSIEALEELYNDAECEILEYWESNSLTESKRRKKSKKRLGGYITYTTGDPDLNIKHFNKMHGTLGFGGNGDADQYDMVVGDTLPSGPETSGDGGESSGDGGMGESLDEASNLTPEEKMKEFDAGRRRENVKACSDQKLQMYHDICKQSGYTNALDKIEAEMTNRGLITPKTKLSIVLQGLRSDILRTDPADAFYLIDARNFNDITDSIGLDSKTAQTKIHDDMRYLIAQLLFAMKFRPEFVTPLRVFITEHYTVTSAQLKQYITLLLGDENFVKRFNSAVAYVRDYIKAKKQESLTEAKRYVKRYYVRPQNIFCSNKEDILLALLRVGDENCSVYSLKNLKDHDDVHLLKPSDIIYYYDDGVLYDKNHVKVMDYDLFVKHEEKRKKYSNVEKAPEADVNKEYDDRLTKDDLQDKEAVANFKAINEKYTRNSLKEALDNNEIVDLGINDTDFAKSQSLDLDCVGNDFTAQKQDNSYVIKAYLILNDGNKENVSFCKVCLTYEDLIKEIQKIPFTVSNLDFGDDLIEDAFDLDFEDRNVFGEALEDKEDTHICCICGEEFTGYGNNPAPVKHSGVACDSCNTRFVIPARLSQLNKKEEEE